MVQLLKIYTDLDLDFIPHPMTNDITKKLGFDAVSRSIRNLVFTNFYERPFRPSIGSGARRLLFDLASNLTANMLRDHIINVIQNFEPRAQLKNVTITYDTVNLNSYTATIEFTMANLNGTGIVSIILERIR